MSTETYNFSQDFQDALLACLIRYPDEFYAFGEIIKSTYFTGPAATEVVHHLKAYREKFNECPNFTTLGNFAFHATQRINADHAKETLEYIEKLANTDTSNKKGLLAMAVQFARERALYDAIRQIHAAQVEGKGDEINAEQLIKDAQAVGLNLKEDGVSLYDDYEKVIRTVNDRDYGVRTGYPEFDKLWKNGWAPGWLIVLLAPPKRFKCQHPDTEILMFDGTTKRISSIKVGDKVMGDDSTARNVLSCGTGYGPMFKVSQANGDAYTVNSDHVLCLKRLPGTEPLGGRWQDRYHEGSLLEITAEDYAKKPKWFKRTWKGYKVGVEFKSASVPLDPYFVGLWLGDGNTNSPTISVGDGDPEITNYLFEIAAGENTRVNIYRGKTRCVQFNFPRKSARQPNPITVKLRAIGVLGSKHIPDVYRINSRTVRLQLLAGLIDSDGSHAKNRGFIFVNTNEQLCKDTCWLARSLGFKSFVRKVKTACEVRGKTIYSTAYRTYVQGQISEIPVKVARKRGKNSAKASDRTTIKVKPVGDGQWFGIEIDGNRRYLHGDFTVTHNTGFAINLALGIAQTQDADVLYYACELTQELAAYRALTNVTGWTQDHFGDNIEKGILVAGKKLKEKMWGNIWFKGYPSKSTSISEIKAHARHVIATYGLKPKAIVIDYAETVRPDSVDKKSPDWRQQADIYTQARAMGAELGCCVILPDRCNRETVGKAVPNMSSFQGAFEKAGIVDAAIGICASDDEYKHDRVRYFIFLNRHGDALKHYDGTVDPTTMTMTVGGEIEYNADDEESDSDAKPRKKNRKPTAGARLTQADGPT